MEGRGIAGLRGGGSVRLAQGPVRRLGGDSVRSVLITIAPGRFAQFFVDVAQDLKRRGETEPRQVGQLIAEHAKEYGCEVYLDQIPALMEQHHLR